MNSPLTKPASPASAAPLPNAPLPGSPTDRKEQLEFSGSQERGAQVLLFLGLAKSAIHGHQFAEFEGRHRIANLVGRLPQVNEVLAAAQAIESDLSVVGTKRTTVIGFRDGTPLAQALAALYPDVVRRVVLVDPTARVSPGFALRVIDRIETILPLGLPLRALSDNFDSRPLLHRIRCPALILSSPSAGTYLRQQSEYIARKIPNARHEQLLTEAVLPTGQLAAEISARLLQFLQAAAKKPQKNL